MRAPARMLYGVVVSGYQRIAPVHRGRMWWTGRPRAMPARVRAPAGNEIRYHLPCWQAHRLPSVRDREEARPRGLPRQSCGRRLPMEDMRFDRHFRTPYSEGYHLMRGTARVGTIDLHYTSTTVHCTLIVEQQLEKAE